MIFTLHIYLQVQKRVKIFLQKTNNIFAILPLFICILNFIDLSSLFGFGVFFNLEDPELTNSGT